MKFYIFSALVAVSCGFPLTPSGDADNVKAALANMNADQLLKITKKGLSFAQLEEEALPAGLGDSMMALIEAALTSNDEAQQANKASLANNGNLITSTVKSIAEKGEAIGQEKKKQADLVAKKEKLTGEQKELEATLAALVSVESELNEEKGDIADEKSTILALKTYTESLGPWVKCARENGVCSCTTTVRYGENGVFTKKPAPPSGTIGCNNGVFGDPLVGTFKHCHCEDAKRTLPEDLESGTLELVETALQANSEAQEANAKALADTENSISETRDAIATKKSAIEQCGVDHAASVEREGNLNDDKVVLEETLKELKAEKENLETVQVRLDAELASIRKLKRDILVESGIAFKLRGRDGTEQLRIVVGDVVETKTVTKEDQLFEYDYPSSGDFSITFLNDQGLVRDAFFTPVMPPTVGITHPGHWSDWNCDTGGQENVRCDNVRAGTFAWNGEYPINLE